MYKLSVRDNIFIKEAGFIDDAISGAISNISDKLSFKTKPFESILGFLTPLLAKSLWGKLLWAFAESYGIGLSRLGAWIDKQLGFGNPEKVPDVSLGQMDSVADQLSTSFANKIISNPLDTMKQFVPAGISDAFGSKNNSNGLVKEGAGLFSFFKGHFANLFKNLIPSVVKAVGLAGVAGAGKKVLFDGVGTTNINQQQESKKDIQFYKNTLGDIEQTLIHFLDASVAKIKNPDGTSRNFSDTFYNLRGYELQGSPEMSEVLEKTKDINESRPLSMIEQEREFMAPSVSVMIKMLLPESSQSPTSSVLPPIPKYTPKPTAPLAKKDRYLVKNDPKEDMKNLLKGQGILT